MWKNRECSLHPDPFRINENLYSSQASLLDSSFGYLFRHRLSLCILHDGFLAVSPNAIILHGKKKLVDLVPLSKVRLTDVNLNLRAPMMLFPSNIIYLLIALLKTNWCKETVSMILKATLQRNR